MSAFNFLTKELKLYKRLVKMPEKPGFAEVKKPVGLNELRELLLFPPIYVGIVEEYEFYQEKLFKCLIFTEEVDLGYFSKNPLLRIDQKRKLLVGLPLWIYLSEDFLFEHSEFIGKFNFKKCLEFAESALLPPKGTPQREYLDLITERLADFNTKSLLTALYHLEKAETKIILPREIREEQEREYSYLLAAKGKNVIKGPNFLGYIESRQGEANLTLYLPTSYLGKPVKIWLRDKLIFEGVLDSAKVVLEDFPILPDYSYLEEELRVSL